MTVVYNNNFEGGSDETTVSTANSGGSSGTAFSAVQIDSGAVVKFDTAQAAHGTLSVRIDPSANTLAYVRWALSAYTETWGRFYLYLTANPAADLRIVQHTNAGGSVVGRIAISTTGKLKLLDNASVVQATSTTSVSLNQWVRVEFHFIHSTTVGQIETKLFNTMDSLVADEITTTAANINTGAETSNIRFGCTATNVNDLPAFWMDDLQANNTEYPGPTAASIRKNNAEGGSNGVGVTIDNAGGISGTTWDSIAGIAGSATFTFDNTHARGTLSYKVNATSGDTDWIAWTSAFGTQTTYFGRVYIYVTAVPTNTYLFHRMMTGTSVEGSLGYSSSGKVLMRDSAGTLMATTTGNLTTNAWNRVEWKFICNASTGSGIIRTYTSDPDAASASFTEEVASTAAWNTGSGSDGYRFGRIAAVAQVDTFWLDNMGVSSIDWLGPALSERGLGANVGILLPSNSSVSFGTGE